MTNPFTTPIRVFFGVVGGVAALVAIFFAYKAYDSWQAGRRQAHLAAAGVQGDSAKADINSGALLAAKADTQYVPYTRWRNRPDVRADPLANELGNRADSTITTLKAAIKADTNAIRHLQNQVTELQDAGPPLGPRAIPYLDVGYGASSRHRAVPVGRLGITYRLLPHVMAKLEGSYEPPPAGSTEQKPEWRVFVGGQATFR